MRSEVRQFGINPDTHAAGALPCIGGPCDGQHMQCSPGYVLLVVRTVADQPVHAVALTPPRIALAKRLGTYVGHYEIEGAELRWRIDAE